MAACCYSAVELSHRFLKFQLEIIFRVLSRSVYFNANQLANLFGSNLIASSETSEPFAVKPGPAQRIAFAEPHPFHPVTPSIPVAVHSQAL